METGGLAGDKRYPHVADALTLYVWRAPAVRVARWAAAAGLPEATFIVAEVLLSLLVFACFWRASYWAGLIAAVPVMVLSISALLAERSAASPPLARRIRQATDIIFPLLWWWGWAHGLAGYGRPLHPVYAVMVLWVVVGGTIAINVIEGLALRRFGFEIHAWRPLDSRFRLVSAARNPNLVILAGTLLFRRPDSGLVLVAWWTLISLIVHSVRLAQMTELQARRQKIASWLDQ